MVNTGVPEKLLAPASLLLLMSVLGAQRPAPAAGFDHSLLGRETLAERSPPSHPAEFSTRESRLAYWINAYNAFVVKGVGDAWPTGSVRSIRPLYGFFWRLRFTVGGRRYALREIENDLLPTGPGNKRSLVAFLLLLGALSARGETPVGPPPDGELEAGFGLLYNLQFHAAEEKFHQYQQRHGDDALGYAAEAAGLAFEEFYRLGLLESKNFLGLQPAVWRSPAKGDEQTRRRFYAVQATTEKLAQQRLGKDRNDRNALFALVLASGLAADYTYLVEKRGWESLKHTRQADHQARQLLARDPAYYDAYLPLGAAGYIAANLPTAQRFLLRLAGVSGDKSQALKQLEVTAERGRLLKPFAKILLALAYVREKEPKRARPLLLELKEEFPSNPIFPRELALLEGRAAPAGNSAP